VGEITGVEWARGPHTKGGTWNPWRGCHKISPACAHCYMFREQTMYGKDPNVVVRCSPATFNAPLKWKEPQGIFTCSWSDFFIEEADPWREDAYKVIQATPRHTYLVLTKRPERMRPSDYHKNVWHGVSVENERFYWRIEKLTELFSQLRFLSIEPLLGPMPCLPLKGIGWVIVGGESGANFRPLNLDWVREIRDQCIDRHVPFFFKQKSALRPKKLDRLLDGREWNGIPVLPDCESVQTRLKLG
jgi:protein gp37